MTAKGISFEAVTMVEGEDWLFRPVMEGMISADRLIDGSIDLNFIALLNEAIAIRDENMARANKAEAAKRGNK